MYPDSAQYLRHFPAFAQVFGGVALDHGTALFSDAGAALWMAPDAAPDEEALVALVDESVGEAERADTFALFDEMARCHPREPHWCLPLIGVEPAWQGRGQAQP